MISLSKFLHILKLQILEFYQLLRQTKWCFKRNRNWPDIIAYFKIPTKLSGSLWTTWQDSGIGISFSKKDSISNAADSVTCIYHDIVDQSLWYIHSYSQQNSKYFFEDIWNISMKYISLHKLLQQPGQSLQIGIQNKSY